VSAATELIAVCGATNPSDDAGCGVLAWARWGLMTLTGPTTGPPTAPAGPAGRRIAGWLDDYHDIAGIDLDPGWLLAGRAAEVGCTRRGRVSVNGSARLLPATDSWCAVNLARPDDIDLLPAATATAVPTDDPWPALATWTAARSATDAVTALQALGLPAARLGEATGGSAVRTARHGASVSAARPPRVVDFSAMWAGPLAAHLLHRAGATVRTAEDPRRPDGARFGPPGFYAGLHGGREHLEVDFSRPDRLRNLIADADVVIEASRPRALRRLGLAAEDWLAARPGRVWLSITGYGRRGSAAERVAFGDDAAVAGGLVGVGDDGRPVFAGDAIADPLTGLRAATAVQQARAAGGGVLVDVSMAGVCAEAMAPGDGTAFGHRIVAAPSGWTVQHATGRPVDVRESPVGVSG
jgi:hypothetical protein